MQRRAFIGSIGLVRRGCEYGSRPFLLLNNCSVGEWLTGAVRFGEPASCNSETLTRLSLSLPFSYSQFFMQGFESVEEPGGGTWEIQGSGGPGDYSNTAWGTPPVGGWGDVTFGSLDDSTPTTSYSAQSSSNLQCSGCTWVFGGNETTFNLGASSSDFTIEAVQGGGDTAESILVWTAGSICLR